MPLPAGYTLDQPVKLPPGYTLDAGAAPDASTPAAQPYHFTPPGAVSVPMSNAEGPITPKGLDKPLSTAERIATAPLAATAGAMQQTGQGMTQVAHPQSGDDFAQGVSNVARGVGTLALPFVAPALAANPIRNATAIAAGTVAGKGTEEGLKAAGVPPGYSALAGTAAGGAAGYGTARGISALGAVDPHVAGLRAWGFEKDPRILDQIKSGEVKLTSGLSDLKTTGKVKGPYANESVLDALPAAKDANRAAWNEWMMRARGQARMGSPIIRSTADALKSTINDPRAQAILQDADRQYNQPLTPDDLARMLEEKNGELKSFYSQSKEVQAAAERAGADTLKNRALLEAQARAIRNLLYQTLDPQGGGAGPAEIQGRYGALKAIEEAANARRTGIIQEHPVNPMERVSNVHLDPRAAIKARQGSSEWLIENAINAAPDAGPLPRPTGMYPMNPRQLGPGPITTPPPADTSFVRSAPAMAQPPNPARALPAAPMIRAAGPITPDASFARGVPGMAQPPNPARALPPATTRFTPPPDAAGAHPTTQPNPITPFQGPTLDLRSPVPPQDVSGTIGGNVAHRLGKAILDAVEPKGTAPSE